MQDPGIWGYVGLIVGGFVGKIVQAEALSWARIAGIMGTILLLALGIIGWLTNRGVDSLQLNMMRIESKVDGTNKLTMDLKAELGVANAKTEAKNVEQDNCIARIERAIDKMQGSKIPRLGGGEMGDSK